MTLLNRDQKFPCTSISKKENPGNCGPNKQRKRCCNPGIHEAIFEELEDELRIRLQSFLFENSLNDEFDKRTTVSSYELKEIICSYLYNKQYNMTHSN